MQSTASVTMMRNSRLHGWKWRAWAAASVAWSGYYFHMARDLGHFPPQAAGNALQFLFNWLFPVALLYLMLTVGGRKP
jgi:hypothetical protein